jgi:hypothetical protein
VDLPDPDDAGGYGDVVVTVRGHESNNVPLTMWHGKMRYEVKYLGLLGSCDATMKTEYDIYIRADIHRYRERPGEEPVTPEGIIFTIALTSTGTWSYSGSTLIFGVPCELATLSGGGDLPVCDPERPDQQPAYYSVYGTINAKQHTINVRVAAPNIDGSEVGGQVQFAHCDGSTNTDPLDMVILDIVMNTFSMQMDGSYNIQSGRKTGNTTLGFNVYHEGTIEWDSISAESAPAEFTHAMAPGSSNADLLSESILCRYPFGGAIA